MREVEHRVPCQATVHAQCHEHISYALVGVGARLGSGVASAVKADVAVQEGEVIEAAGGLGSAAVRHLCKLEQPFAKLGFRERQRAVGVVRPAVDAQLQRITRPSGRGWRPKFQPMLLDLSRLQANKTMLRKPKLPGEKFLNSQRVAATRLLPAEQASLDGCHHLLLSPRRPARRARRGQLGDDRPSSRPFVTHRNAQKLAKSVSTSWSPSISLPMLVWVSV